MPFFLWAGIFNLMVVAQFWSFANDVYTNDEGERLFPLVQFGASLGAVLGSVGGGRSDRAARHLSADAPGRRAPACSGLAVTTVVDRRERRRTESHRPPGSTTLTNPAATGEFRLETGEYTNLREALKEALARAERGEEPEEPEPAPEPEPDPPERAGAAVGRGFVGSGAFQLVFRTRYLLLIALLVLLVNWVNTTGEYILGRLVEETAIAAVAEGTTGLTVGQYIGRFYSRFFSVVNVVSLLLQLFLVSRIVKYLGVRLAIMILPVIAVGGYALLAFFPAARGRPLGEDGRERHRLLLAQHGTEHPFPPVDPRAEIQGETGDRRLLLAGRGRAVRRRGVRRHDLAVDARLAVRAAEPGARRRMAGDRLAGRHRVPGARADRDVRRARTSEAKEPRAERGETDVQDRVQHTVQGQVRAPAAGPSAWADATRRRSRPGCGPGHAHVPRGRDADQPAPDRLRAR